jgi:hypothetical protein
MKKFLNLEIEKYFFQAAIGNSTKQNKNRITYCWKMTASFQAQELDKGVFLSLFLFNFVLEAPASALRES